MRKSIYTKNLLLFCATFVFSTNVLFAQKDIKNPNISYVRNEYNQILQIDFIIGKGDSKKSFAVYENNPYNKLSYQKENKKALGYNIYKIDNAPISELLPGFKSECYKNKSIGEIKINGLVTNSFVGYSEDKKNQIVIYQLSATQNGDIKGTVSTILIVDTTGTIEKKLENIETNINKIGITTDGKYLFLSYGLDNEDGTILEHGVRIYDLKKNKILVEKKHPLMGGFITNNLVIIGYDYNLNNELLSYIEVYDFYNSKKYTRTFKYNEQRIIEKTKEGYLIYFNNKQKLISFKNDFLNENL